MDLSAVNVNVTVDDFDSVISYPVQSAWLTPDPSSPSFNASVTPWWMGTYHTTNVINASLSFNFTGPAIYIYGGSGPTYGSYDVQIDSASSTLSAYSANNASSPHLLYGNNNLTYATHSLVLRNLGAIGSDAGGGSFLFDSLQTTVQLAPAGATVSNTTLQETDASLHYSGTWGNNTSPAFSGGGTAFTNQDNASVSFSFHGSALYVFGDKKDDHGLYGVTLDNGTNQVFDDVSGCGGGFAMTCEQQHPTLKYFASNLNDQLHQIEIVNMAGVNHSFFDLDSIVITVPSVYAPRQLSNSTSSPSGSATLPSPTTSTNNNDAASTLGLSNSLLLLVFIATWLFRSCFSH